MQGDFYGWYLKCQSDRQTLAVIPAVHGAGQKSTCSIQFITEKEAWTIPFSGNMYCKNGKRISIVKNRFGKRGILLEVHTPEIVVKGQVSFDALTPLKYDIMGPFSLIPFMECRHSVYSMFHRVNGLICINDKEYVFENAYGYWEGDRGRSFPKEYAWTHSFIEGRDGKLEGSLMLSVADIPLAGLHFTGIIGIVFWKGKEYRLATYLGARVVQKEKGILLIRQGNMEFEARLLEQKPHPLQAPVNGAMTRTIHENIICKAFYRFRKNGVTQFSFETDKASFEYEYEWRRLC